MYEWVAPPKPVELGGKSSQGGYVRGLCPRGKLHLGCVCFRRTPIRIRRQRQSFSVYHCLGVHVMGTNGTGINIEFLRTFELLTLCCMNSYGTSPLGFALRSPELPMFEKDGNEPSRIYSIWG